MNTTNATRWYGPWFVGLGAGLWGAESLFRIWLTMPPEVMVFYEHVIQLFMFLLLFLFLDTGSNRKKIPLSAYGYILLSGIAGSAGGTVFFTLALKHNPLVANLVLTIQPIISTAIAYFWFKDRLSRNFFFYAGLALIAVLMLVFLHAPDLQQKTAPLVSPTKLSISTAAVFALLCAGCWALSTVAGRGAMLYMNLATASLLRVSVGMVAMLILLSSRGMLSQLPFWRFPQAPYSLWYLLGLSILTGGIPLLFYFYGLRHTRASTAGYFEMLQVLTGVICSWIASPKARSLLLQDPAVLVKLALQTAALFIIVTLIQREQRTVETEIEAGH